MNPTITCTRTCTPNVQVWFRVWRLGSSLRVSVLGLIAEKRLKHAIPCGLSHFVLGRRKREVCCSTFPSSSSITSSSSSLSLSPPPPPPSPVLVGRTWIIVLARRLSRENEGTPMGLADHPCLSVFARVYSCVCSFLPGCAFVRVRCCGCLCSCLIYVALCLRARVHLRTHARAIVRHAPVRHRRRRHSL
jgi:hypothetical protein